MPNFKYAAITSDGKRLEGEKIAESKDAMISFLQEKNLTVVSLNEKIAIDFKNVLSGDIGGIPLKEKLVLARQLSTMITAGIPLIQALDILIQQAEKPSLKSKLQDVYKSVESGTSLSEALRRQTGIFSDVHLSLIAAGEKSANLNEMLEKIAVDLEKSKNLRGKITGALIYPAIIFVALIVVFILMVTTMIPQVKELYRTLGQEELPFITELLLQFGNALNNPFGMAALIIFTIASIATYKYANSTYKGRRAIDRFKMKVPIFGQLIRKYELVQFCRLSSMLLKSGVQIIEVMTIVQRTANNKIYNDILKNSIDEVTKGTGLAMSIAKFNENDAFPIILIKIIATGEETGKIDKTLEDMGNFYESELEQLSSNLTKIMEPLIMVIAGGMVAFMAIAVYLPIFQVGQFVQ